MKQLQGRVPAGIRPRDVMIHPRKLRPRGQQDHSAVQPAGRERLLRKVPVRRAEHGHAFRGHGVSGLGLALAQTPPVGASDGVAVRARLTSQGGARQAQANPQPVDELRRLEVLVKLVGGHRVGRVPAQLAEGAGVSADPCRGAGPAGCCTGG